MKLLPQCPTHFTVYMNAWVCSCMYVLMCMDHVCVLIHVFLCVCNSHACVLMNVYACMCAHVCVYCSCAHMCVLLNVCDHS